MGGYWKSGLHGIPKIQMMPLRLLQAKEIAVEGTISYLGLDRLFCVQEAVYQAAGASTEHIGALDRFAKKRKLESR